MKNKSLQSNSQKLQPKQPNPRRPDTFTELLADSPWLGIYSHRNDEYNRYKVR